MVQPLSFQLTLLFNETAVDNWGSWQYAAANVQQGTQQVAQLIATKRINSYGDASFSASMLTATLIFLASDGLAPANLTLQGIHDLATNNETGSVSSASPKFAPYIGGNFTFDAGTGILTISPPG